MVYVSCEREHPIRLGNTINECQSVYPADQYDRTVKTQSHLISAMILRYASGSPIGYAAFARGGIARRTMEFP